MPRLRNALVYDLLAVAQSLSETMGRPNLRKAALRRAASTAYYSVFHALCFVCASELVGWSQSEDLEPIYRSVDHGFARERLASSDAAKLGKEILTVGAALAWLQDQRHKSDYASSGLKDVSRKWAEESIELARQTITLLEDMEQVQRRQLAILLIARPRREPLAKSPSRIRLTP